MKKKLIRYFKIILFVNLFVFTTFASVSCSSKKLKDLDSHFIRLDSVNIHYKMSIKNQKTLIFVHGWGCDLNVWGKQFDYFNDKYSQVFIDLPGYGKSDKANVDYSLDYFSKAVEQVINELKIHDAILIGHSMGFPVCRQVLRNNKELKAKLCILDGVYFKFPADSLENVKFKNELENFANMFEIDNFSNTTKEFANAFIVNSTDKDSEQYINSTMNNTNSMVGYSSMKNLIDEKYWYEDVCFLPTLAIYAQNKDLPIDNKDYLNSLFNDLEYHQLDSVGHFIMLEKPHLFNNLLENFIEADN